MTEWEKAQRGFLVVNRDIPSNVVAAGNPCKVLREITEQDKKKYPVWREDDPQ